MASTNIIAVEGGVTDLIDQITRHPVDGIGIFYPLSIGAKDQFLENTTLSTFLGFNDYELNMDRAKRLFPDPNPLGHMYTFHHVHIEHDDHTKGFTVVATLNQLTGDILPYILDAMGQVSTVIIYNTRRDSQLFNADLYPGVKTVIIVTPKPIPWQNITSPMAVDNVSFFDLVNHLSDTGVFTYTGRSSLSTLKAYFIASSLSSDQQNEEAKGRPRDMISLGFTNPEMGYSRILASLPGQSLKDLTRHFQELGGTILPTIFLDFYEDKISPMGEKKHVLSMKPTDRIRIPLGAHVWPVDQAGENRVQITYWALRDHFGRFIWVRLPHGAEGALDPYILPTMTPNQMAIRDLTSEQWDRELAYQYHPVRPEPLFTTFGRQRIQRFGEAQLTLTKQTIDKIITRDLATLTANRAWMAANYYGNFVNLPTIPRLHTNFAITYNRATHIMMARLVEVATTYGGRLDSAVIQPIVSIDPIVMKIPMQLYNIIVNNTDIIGVSPSIMGEARKTFKYMDPSGNVVFAT